MLLSYSGSPVAFYELFAVNISVAKIKVHAIWSPFTINKYTENSHTVNSFIKLVLW